MICKRFYKDGQTLEQPDKKGREMKVGREAAGGL